MPPAPPPLSPAEADGHCLIDAEVNGRLIWLLPAGTPYSHVRCLLQTGVGVVRGCGFEAPPGGVCMGVWPPDVLRLPFVEDSGDSVVGVDPGWREEVSDAFAAAGASRPAAGDVIAVLAPGPEGPFPGPREILRTAGNAGLLAFRNGRNCLDDGTTAQFAVSQSIGILNIQGALGSPMRVLEENCLHMMKHLEGFDSEAFAPWPLWPAGNPVVVVPGDGTTGPTALVCFRAPDARRAESAFESAFAAGVGGLPPFPETLS